MEYDLKHSGLGRRIHILPHNAPRSLCGLTLERFHRTGQRFSAIVCSNCEKVRDVIESDLTGDYQRELQQ